MFSYFIIFCFHYFLKIIVSQIIHSNYSLFDTIYQFINNKNDLNHSLEFFEDKLFNRNNQSLLFSYNNSPVIEFTIIEIKLNDTILKKKQNLNQSSIENYSLSNNNSNNLVIVTEKLKRFIYYDKIIYNHKIQDKILFTYKGLIFVKTINDEIGIFKYTNNFLIKKDMKNLIVKTSNNICSINSEMKLSAVTYDKKQYIIMKDKSICIFELFDEDPIFNRIKLKEFTSFADFTPPSKEVIFFTMLKDHIIIIIKSGPIRILNYQGQIKEDIRTFKIKRIELELKVIKADYLNENLYVLDEKYGFLIYSVDIHSNSLKLINNIPLVISFNVNNDKLYLSYSSIDGKDNSLSVVSINNNFKQLSSLSTSHAFQLNNILNYEKFTVFYEKQSNRIYLISPDSEITGNNLLFIKEFFIQESVLTPKKIFIVEEQGNKYLGIILSNDQVIFIKNLKVANGMIDMKFFQKGRYDLKMMVLVEYSQKKKSLYLLSQFTVNSSQIYQTETMDYTYSKNILYAIAIFVIIMSLKYFYNYITAQNEKSPSQGYSLTSSKEIKNTPADEDKMILDIELDIKAT